jgi:hypothetical protein
MHVEASIEALDRVQCRAQLRALFTLPQGACLGRIPRLTLATAYL